MANNLGDVGQVIWRVVAGRGVQKKKTVWELAKAGEHIVSQQMVNQYILGRHRVPRDFLRALDKQLGFTKQEKTEIVRAVSEEMRTNPDLKDFVAAMDDALGLSEGQRLSVGWKYVWGEHRPASDF